MSGDWGGWPTHPLITNTWVPHPDAASSRMGGMNECPRYDLLVPANPLLLIPGFRHPEPEEWLSS